MDNNITTVKKLYSEERMLNELKESALSNRIKIWEKEVVSHLPERAWILDIGCGMGREAFYLYDMGFKITAIDISEKAIEGAKQIAVETGRCVEFIKTDGIDLPFEDNTFDTIIIWNQTFGLFYGEENQLHILEECHRVLKKNGIMSFSGHSLEFVQQNHPKYVEGKKFYAIADTDCYWELFTASEIKMQAEKAGFMVLDCMEGNLYNYSEYNPVLYCECRK